MARNSPIIVDESVLALSNNSTEIKGFAGITAGNLFLTQISGMSPGVSRLDAALTQADWNSYGNWPIAGSDAGWVNNWNMASLSGQRQPTTWRISAGAETNLVDTVGRYGYTSFGSFPIWIRAFRITAFDPDYPVVGLIAQQTYLSAGVAGSLPAIAATELYENGLEIVACSSGRNFGEPTVTRSPTWDTTYTMLTSTADNGGRAQWFKTAIAADGSLPAITITPNVSSPQAVSIRRIIIPGVTVDPPQYTVALIETSARAVASGRNISQELRNNRQSRDSRPLVWVSGLDGQRRGVIR